MQGERDLLRRFRQGDEDAFSKLLEAHAGVLRTRAAHWLGRGLRRRVSVADVLQETWAVAYARRGEFEDRGPDAFRNWLFGILELKAREALRRHAGTAKRSAQREVSRNARPETGEFSAEGAWPLEAAATAEECERVRRALARLPGDYQEILRLAQAEGLALGQAAERMGRSREAAKKLYGRALCRLREEYDKDGR